MMMMMSHDAGGGGKIDSRERGDVGENGWMDGCQISLSLDPQAVGALMR